jgi:hypothetical protein
MKLLTFLTLFTSSLYARDLVGSVNSLASNATQLALAVGTLGIVVTGGMMLFGNHAAKEKLGNALAGSVIIVLASGFIDWIRGIL